MDSSLRMVVNSAGMAQQSPVSAMCVYAVVLEREGERVLVVRKGEGRSVPHNAVDVVAGANGEGKCSVRDSVVRFLHEKVGVVCDSESAYLVKTVLPIRKGPAVAAVVRLEVDKGVHVRVDDAALGAGGPGEWMTRAQVDRIQPLDLHPGGLKELILEAFAQRDFERSVVVF